MLHESRQQRLSRARLRISGSIAAVTGLEAF